VILALLTNTSHNFLHQKDNWRMYLFNLSGLNYREWRVSHVLSHHMYSNTLHDYELYQFEPFIQWTSMKKKKTSDNFSLVRVILLVWLLSSSIALVKR
jgi:Fatty acid desaturase